MNIDITALELLPEIDAAEGLRICRRPTKMRCADPTCLRTKVGPYTIVYAGDPPQD